MFRCFLFESLAEENLLFVEAIDKLRKEKVSDNIKKGLLDLLEQYGSYINLSSVAMTVSRFFIISTNNITYLIFTIKIKKTKTV